MFEAAAGGQTLGETGHLHWQLAKQLRHIICSRFALHICAESEDDLRWRLRLHALDQCLNSQLLWADVLERRDATTERVVEPAECARAFNRKDLRRLLNDA